MTYRLDIVGTPHLVVLAFQGLLDEAALEDVLERLALAAKPVRLVLLPGTEVAPSCVAELRGLPGVELVAESPFLSAWLAQSSK